MQDGDALPFFGLDKTFRWSPPSPTPVASEKNALASSEISEGRDLFTLRADGIQQHDSSWLYSAGVLIPVTKHIVFETWGNFPDNGDDASLTLKLNLVFPFY